MENLSLNLKIFYIEDGEDYFILAENEEQAREHYEKEFIDDELKMEMLEENETDNIRECYSLVEITSDTDEEINITEDEDLFNLINRYRVKDEETLSLYTYAKYFILVSKLRGEELQIPTLIAGSFY